jgi:hypothetical protein
LQNPNTSGPKHRFAIDNNRKSGHKDVVEEIITLKLPRNIETDPRREAIENVLARDMRPIWDKGTLNVAHIAFHDELEKALIAARVGRQLERGLENVEKILKNEEPGLAALRERQGAPFANRASRLLIIADDGTERFYRSCESLLYRHADRVLGLRVAVASDRLAENLFGPEKFAKALLVTERAAVANVLLALAHIPAAPTTQ